MLGKMMGVGKTEHLFSQIPQANIPRSVFDRSHCYKTTFDAGYLVPFYVDEALPGDTFNVAATMFARLTTPIVPFMDNLYLETFFFAVPIRLIWDNFKKFMGEQADPDSSTDFTVPQIVSPASTGWAVGTLSDYFGLPTGIVGLSVASFWHRAYNLIWNEWFRSENLQDSVVVDKDDGPDNNSDYVLLRRCKRHDYFTSCLPWPQKGSAVTLPLGTDAPVYGIGKLTQTYPSSNGPMYETDGSGTRNYVSCGKVDPTLANNHGDYYVENDPNNAGYPNIRADLTNATAATINALRQAFQLQKLLERDARGGTRYTEIVRAHFGVVSPDARLQRPEFLGGGSTPIQVMPVPQTSSTTGSYAQGRLAGFGTALDGRTGFTKSFTEHCVLLGLMNVRADLTYQQGIPRMFKRSTKYDFYFPALANIGEQEVLNQEIYADASGNDTGVFGYQERWAEYRYKPSQITGKLRSTYSTPLDYWHLAQEFGSLPTLSDTFIVENPPIDRVQAVANEPAFVLDSFIKIRAARPMPVYSVPGLIDHF